MANEIIRTSFGKTNCKQISNFQRPVRSWSVLWLCIAKGPKLIVFGLALTNLTSCSKQDVVKRYDDDDGV